MENNLFSHDYFEKLKKVINELDFASIDNVVKLFREAWLSDKQVIILGNGGSSMTALHITTDLNKSPFLATGKRFRGRSLVDNIGLVMAYGNDISFDEIFSQQLMNIMDKGDLVVAISGSGNSPNVVKAVEYANKNGAITVALTGFSGGVVKEIAQHNVWVNVQDMQIAEDIHMIIGHIIMQNFCKKTNDFESK